MKIIEAIKELPLIIKKMENNNRKIQEYSSALTTDTLPFGTEQEQKAEVTSLVQSNTDLRDRYLSITRSLSYTNTQTMVTVGDICLTITEWLAFRGVARTPELFNTFIGTFRAMNVKSAELRLRGQQNVDLTQNVLGIIRMFKQAFVDENIEKFSETFELIDAKLEVVNATTDLIDWKIN